MAFGDAGCVSAVVDVAFSQGFPRMLNGNDRIGSTLFGAPEQIDVDRALAEFRSGRPIKIIALGREAVVLPVEGLTEERFTAFRSLCVPTPPRLIITARRARALGLDASTAMALRVARDASVASLLALVTDVALGRRIEAVPAGAAGSAAIQLIKLAQSLPAVLEAEGCSQAVDGDAGRFVSVNADAVPHFHDAIIRSLTIASEARVPIGNGKTTRFIVFRDITGANSVAVVIGEPDLSGPVAVRLHSACLTGDVFGSRRCDCGDQLRLAIEHLGAAGGGVVLYLPQEGRGLGLVNKMRAYRLQDSGLDTIDANTTLGFDDDERDYAIAARMLAMLGIRAVRLLTNNPAKISGLGRVGIKVAERLPVEAPVNADNRRYLTAKAARAGHQLDYLIAALSSAPDSESEEVAGPASAEPRNSPLKTMV
jgi:GTP cyclohydrolase II